MKDNSTTVVLIGMTGSGKSSIGKRLAEKLKWEFIDIDRYLEGVFERKYNQKKTFTEIYQQHGLDEFTQLENDSLTELSNVENLVVATGGRTPVDKRNRRHLSKFGSVVFLESPISELVRRIIDRGYGKLPNHPQINEIITERLNSRESVYSECSDLKIDNFEKSVEEVCDEILSKL